jgi:glucosamine-6-phosphate deaminase
VRIRILENPHRVARSVGELVRRTLRKNPEAVLGLPTGRTPVLLYGELVRLHRAGRLDFSRVTTFNLDEFAGLPAEHAASYRSFMNAHLFRHVNLRPRRIHFLDGNAADLAAECAHYEAAIKRAGGIDLQILGIGTNGHIGFNEPARELHARTHLARLKPETKRSNAALFGGVARRVPSEALSMGMGTILKARRIVLVATGKTKARAMRHTVRGRLSTRHPSSFLQLHPDVDLYLDRAAASEL